MKKMYKITTLVLGLLLTSCVTKDFKSSDEIALYLENKYFHIEPIHAEGFTFIYRGPLAWSSPEYVIKLWERNSRLEDLYFDMEIISFNVHMPFDAVILFENGHKNIDTIMKNLDANNLSISSSACPKLISKYDELIKVYKKELRNMDYLEDIIMTDGGSYYSFTLQKIYASTNFSTVNPSKEIISVLDGLVNEANDCTSHSIKLPSKIEG